MEELKEELKEVFMEEFRVVFRIFYEHSNKLLASRFLWNLGATALSNASSLPASPLAPAPCPPLSGGR